MPYAHIAVIRSQTRSKLAWHGPSAAFRRACALAMCAATAAVISRATPVAAGEPTRGDNLFFAGKALLAQGHVAEACEKFAESYAIAPRGGTLLNLAVCREKQGLYATAMELLVRAREVAANDHDDERVELATEHIQAVESKLSWLTVRLSAEARVPGLSIQEDGKDVTEESWGAIRPVDPGPHTVVATAPGRKRFEATVVIKSEGDKQVVEIAPLPPENPGKDTPAPETAPAARPAADVRGAAQPDVAMRPKTALPVAAHRQAPGLARRLIGFSAMGAGSLGLVVGTISGGIAISNSNASKLHCSPTDPNFCNAEGVSARQAEKTSGTVSTVAFVSGSALLLAGGLLIWSAPERKPKTVGLSVWATPSGFGLTTEGTW